MNRNNRYKTTPLEGVSLENKDDNVGDNTTASRSGCNPQFPMSALRRNDAVFSIIMIIIISPLKVKLRAYACFLRHLAEHDVSKTIGRYAVSNHRLSYMEALLLREQSTRHRQYSFS